MGPENQRHETSPKKKGQNSVRPLLLLLRGYPSMLRLFRGGRCLENPSAYLLKSTFHNFLSVLYKGLDGLIMHSCRQRSYFTSFFFNARKKQPKKQFPRPYTLIVHTCSKHVLFNTKQQRKIDQWILALFILWENDGYQSNFG